MNAKKREQALKLLLPSALILFVYAWVVTGGINAEVKKTREQLTRAEAKPASPAEIIGARGELAAIRVEKNQLEKRKAELAGASRGGASASNAAGAVGEVLRVLRDHGLYLIEDREVGSEASRLPPALRGVTRSPGGATLWTVQFVGSYPDVLDALRAIGSGDTRATPLSLTMRPRAAGAGMNVWEMTLWI